MTCECESKEVWWPRARLRPSSGAMDWRSASQIKCLEVLARFEVRGPSSPRHRHSSCFRLTASSSFRFCCTLAVVLFIDPLVTHSVYSLALSAQASHSLAYTELIRFGSPLFSCHCSPAVTLDPLSYQPSLVFRPCCMLCPPSTNEGSAQAFPSLPTPFLILSTIFEKQRKLFAFQRGKSS